MANNFGENLQELLKGNNYSIRGLAKELGIPYKTVAEWVGTNFRMPRDPEAIRKMAKLFNCSVHFLLFGEEDPKSLLGEILEKTEIHTGMYEISIKKVKTKGGN